MKSNCILLALFIVVRFFRYIICKSLQSETRDLVRTYLYEINALLNQYKVESEVNDVLSIVPMDILRGNDNFYQYIRNSNNE